MHSLFGLKFWAFVVGAAPLDGELEAFWKELGFVVIQGYGLTETAPIVSAQSSVQYEERIGRQADRRRRSENRGGRRDSRPRRERHAAAISTPSEETARAFEDGWFHTGDIGDKTKSGQIYIRGRKEGNDRHARRVERLPRGRRARAESHTGRARLGGRRCADPDRRSACTLSLVLDPGVVVDDVIRVVNAELEDHQKVRRALVWPEPELPRTEGTRKLKRAEIREWVKSGTRQSPAVHAGKDRLCRAPRASHRQRRARARHDARTARGSAALDRVELMVALEDTFQTHIDESAFSGAQDLSQLRTLVERSAATDAPPAEPVEFPAWSRSWPARTIRRASLPTWILRCARVFAWMRIEGREHLRHLDSPVIFAANHQSHMDAPVILAALPPSLRYRVTTAMAKEFFKAHFYPEQYGKVAWLTNSLNYYLAALFFNAFPLPQREAGARQTLRYIRSVLADGWSVLIFPEGKRSGTGGIDRFRPGVGMIAARLGVPVVPVRLEGLEKVLHPSWRMARPGRVRVAFGTPLRLTGDDYEALAKQVEDAVKRL